MILLSNERSTKLLSNKVAKISKDNKKERSDEILSRSMKSIINLTKNKDQIF